ncbi:MAG: hypothetical protein PVJ42_00235 [bacterium]
MSALLRRSGACWRMIVSLALLSPVSPLLPEPATAAFDLDAATPAPRACSSPEVLGLADGSVSDIYHPPPGSGPACVVGACGYRPFGVDGIEVITARGRLALSGGGAGLSFSYVGLAAPGYAEHAFSASLGISRGPLWLQPGLRLGQFGASGDYGGRAVMFDFLAYSYVAPGLRLAFEVENAFASGLGVQGGAVPSRLRAGIGYAVLRAVACGISIEKGNGLRTAVRTGIEWRVTSGVFLRLGSCTFPREFSLGLGLSIRGLSLDLSSSANIDLGPTHVAGIGYRWN